MNNSIIPLWPSLLPPVCDQAWFTADYPKNEEAELAQLEEELEQEKLQLKEQSTAANFPDSPIPQINKFFDLDSDLVFMERSTAEQVEDEQDYDETEDDSYMGDAASDVDVEPQSPPW